MYAYLARKLPRRHSLTHSLSDSSTAQLPMQIHSDDRTLHTHTHARHAYNADALPADYSKIFKCVYAAYMLSILRLTARDRSQTGKWALGAVAECCCIILSIPSLRSNGRRPFLCVPAILWPYAQFGSARPSSHIDSAQTVQRWNA